MKFKAARHAAKPVDPEWRGFSEGRDIEEWIKKKKWKEDRMKEDEKREMNMKSLDVGKWVLHIRWKWKGRVSTSAHVGRHSDVRVR